MRASRQRNGTENPGRRWPSHGAPLRPVVAAAAAAVTAAGLIAAVTPAASAATPANDFSQANLVASTSALHPKLVDKNLTNAWGLAAGPGEPLWVSDHNSGKATVYSGGVSGSAVTLDLTVPVPNGNPTGQVFNPDGTAFPVGGGWADFIVDTDGIGTKPGGEIAGWDGGAKFVVEDSPTGGVAGKTKPGAIFKGLALATTPTAGPELFAADVANASVDVFNSDFAPVSAKGEFTDPNLPAGYAPFGIQLLDGNVYVTYGKQNAAKTDVVPGAGLGIVDVYNVNGKLLHRLVSNGGVLNAPWGLAIAPKGFGPFAGDLLVGNLGDGKIHAFGLSSGKFQGTLKGSNGKAIVEDGLWGLQAGSSAFGGASSVVFSAGPSGYSTGVVGTLTPTR